MARNLGVTPPKWRQTRLALGSSMIFHGWTGHGRDTSSASSAWPLASHAATEQMWRCDAAAPYRMGELGREMGLWPVSSLMMFNGEDTVTSCNYYKGSDDQQFAFPFW